MHERRIRLVDFRHHARPVLLTGGLMLAAALVEALALLLLVPLLQALGAGGASAGRIAQAFACLGVPLGLGPLLALFVILAVMRAAFAQARTLAQLRLEAAVVDGLRRRAWHGLLHCEWRLLLGLRQSDTVSLLVTDLDRIGVGINQALAGLAALATLFGLGLAALAISVPATLIAVAGGAVVLAGYRGMRRRAMTLGEQLGSAYAAVQGSFQQGLAGLRVIKSLEGEARVEAESLSGLQALRNSQIAFMRDRGLGQVALQGGGAAALALLVWLALVRWQAGPETILPLVALFVRALPLLGAVQEAWQNWSHARPAIAATQSLIRRAEAAREPDSDGVTAPALDRELKLENVSLRFSGELGSALAGVNLALPARTTTAICGASGAGKSTLADIVGGLLAPSGGRVLVDGVPLEGPLRRAWRTRVAYVQQEPVLFTGSIRDNLLRADPGADEGRLEQALRDAAAGFVFDLCDGLDTQVGDGGRHLSGGERQRLVLARALLRRPSLLVLDEATSALDARNEGLVADALRLLHGQLTILVICHRGVLADLADRVVVLDHGRVAENRLREA